MSEKRFDISLEKTIIRYKSMNESGPVQIAVPNTIKEKMQAIVNLSEAVRQLAVAINSVNTQISVTGCTFNVPENSVGLSIAPEVI